MASNGEQPPRNQPPPTASGLDEQQIHAEDIAALQALFKPHSVMPGLQASLYRHTASLMESGLPRAVCHQAGLELAAPRSLALRIAPLPAKINARQVSLRMPRMKLRKDMKAVMNSPVLRRKQHVDDLPRPVQKALFEAVFRRYGEDARNMEVCAVFAHIPPEAAQSIKLGPELEAATFVWPANLPVAKAKAGHYLVILEQPEGQTRNVIFRLE